MDRGRRFAPRARTPAEPAPRVGGRERGRDTASRGRDRHRFRGDLAARRAQALRRDPRRRRPGSRGAERGVLRAARAQRRRQVDDDADADGAGARGRGRDRGARLRAAARIQAGTVGDGRRPAARQPRRRAHLPPDSPRVRAPVPRPAGRTRGSRRARPGHRQPATARRHDRARALRRHAPAAARRARLDPPSAPGPARRAHGRPRPPDPPGAVVADRRPAGAAASPC